MHSAAEIKKLILRLVIPAKAGIHCVADIFCSPCGAIDTRLRGYDDFIFYFAKLLFSDAKKKAVTPTSGPAKIENFCGWY